jgi:DNA-binding transcriptional regulator YiaG
MPNIAHVLKEEIRRLARKEIRSEVRPLRKEKAQMRRYVAALKRRAAALEREIKRLYRVAPTPAAPPETAKRSWITSRGIRSLRRRMRLSQKQFAKLTGVSGQAVYQWERRGRKLDLRKRTQAAIAAVRHLGAREARRRLEDMSRSLSRRRPKRKK